MSGLVPWIPMLPLLAAIACGLAGKTIGRLPSAIVAIAAVGLSFLLSALVALEHFKTGEVLNFDWYVWSVVGDTTLKIGFLVDGLTSVMILVVTFVSLMVHIYTMGYMREDPGYQRFFSYIALFTFSMLMLVLSNNFLQLFFGWEAVGLVSYLLIGFWFVRPTAIRANLKAFLVNRVGDFGFIIGIGLVLAYLGSLDYAEAFDARASLEGQTLEILPGKHWQVATVLCLALFIGAMGKSAQFPLHVWLPDSMEGPTPISALIHAATMVTAGIFMVARMAPLFELSETALAVVMVIGGVTAFFMALLGLVQNDIKRVVAYSTLSQLGYMTAALGASAYSVAIFHLTTHAFFKALLFLGAGAVIVALHHEQDMRGMGGLRKKMPITFWTMVVGSLALCGIPPFAGFFSKDLIIAAVQGSELGVSSIVYPALVLSVFITSFYSFRLMAIVFGGTGQVGGGHDKVRDCDWTISVPLVLLAVPSVLAGYMLMEPILSSSWFVGAGEVVSADSYNPAMSEELTNPNSLLAHAPFALAFYIAVAGVIVALYMYILAPSVPGKIARMSGPVNKILLAKYGSDEFTDTVVAGVAKKLGGVFWRGIDGAVIDGSVDGSASLVRRCALSLRGLQSGRIYHYAFAMIISLSALLFWLLST